MPDINLDGTGGLDLGTPLLSGPLQPVWNPYDNLASFGMPLFPGVSADAAKAAALSTSSDPADQRTVKGLNQDAGSVWNYLPSVGFQNPYSSNKGKKKDPQPSATGNFTGPVDLFNLPGDKERLAKITDVRLESELRRRCLCCFRSRRVGSRVGSDAAVLEPPRPGTDEGSRARSLHVHRDRSPGRRGSGRRPHWLQATRRAVHHHDIHSPGEVSDPRVRVRQSESIRLRAPHDRRDHHPDAVLDGRLLRFVDLPTDNCRQDGERDWAWIPPDAPKTIPKMKATARSISFRH